jgi:uncharacterized membrane protein YbjE (DUF340 family)
MSLLQNKLFKWGRASLVGHLVLFEMLAGLPLFLFSLITMFTQSTLTLVWALKIGLLCMVVVAIGAALFWYSISSPLMKQRGNRT